MVKYLLFSFYCCLKSQCSRSLLLGYVKFCQCDASTVAMLSTEFDRNQSPVYHTERPPLCTTRWAWRIVSWHLLYLRTRLFVLPATTLYLLRYCLFYTIFNVLMLLCFYFANLYSSGFVGRYKHDSSVCLTCLVCCYYLANSLRYGKYIQGGPKMGLLWFVLPFKIT